MTVRAVILGVVASVLVATLGYFNDQIWRLTFLVGNHFPIGVFGLLIAFMLLGNPLMRRGPWRRFSPAELAVMVSLVLFACSIPGSSLMRHFLPSLAMPVHYNRSSAGWRRTEVLRYIPPAMLPNDGHASAELFDGFLTGGLGKPGRPAGLDAVPWRLWSKPLLIWGPLILLTGIAAVCLGLIVHRQWSSRELLAYPIAAFAKPLMLQEEGRALPAVFRNRLFWAGLLPILAIRVVNGLYVWTDGRTIQIPLQFHFLPLLEALPELAGVPEIHNVIHPILYPTAAAFCFFLATDVGLSLGIAQAVYVALWLAMLSAGINVAGHYYRGGPISSQLFGAGLGIALLVAYTGRRYYWGVLKAALGLPRMAEVEPYAAWACRALIAALAGVTGMLIWLGLPWPLALMTVGLIMLVYVVMARLNAEAGLFYFQVFWQPIAVLTGLFGSFALGPEALVLAGLLCTVLTVDPRECLLPFVINALKISDDLGVRPARVGGTGMAVFGLCLALAVPTVLWANYNFGLPRWDLWATESVPKFAFDTGEQAINDLNAAGHLEQSRSLTVWQRAAAMRPDRNFLIWAGMGLTLVLMLSVLRLRYTWWPIHPVLLLVVGTAPLIRFGPSFLLGWLVKVAVTRLGGGQAYQRLKPLMIGVIGGDMLGGLIFMAYGAWYHLQTGLTPKAYLVFPT